MKNNTERGIEGRDMPIPRVNIPSLDETIARWQGSQRLEARLAGWVARAVLPTVCQWPNQPLGEAGINLWERAFLCHGGVIMEDAALFSGGLIWGMWHAGTMSSSEAVGGMALVATGYGIGRGLGWSAMRSMRRRMEMSK